MATTHNEEMERLRAENARLRAALEPFAEFARKWRAKPLSGLSDELYGIHGETEWSAKLRLSDCNHALEVLTATDLPE